MSPAIVDTLIYMRVLASTSATVGQKYDKRSSAEEEVTMSIKRPADSWHITRKPVHPGEMLREEFIMSCREPGTNAGSA